MHNKTLSFLIIAFTLFCKKEIPTLDYDRLKLPPNKTKLDIVELYQILPFEVFYKHDIPLELKELILAREANYNEMGGEQIWGYHTINKANGFLSIRKPDMMGSDYKVEFAVWRKTGDSSIVGINSTYGFQRNSRLNFYEFKSNEWSDVTNQIFPGLQQNEFYKLNPNEKLDPETLQKIKEILYYCELPEKGFTITCTLYGEYMESLQGNQIFDILFDWKNDKFVKRKQKNTYFTETI
ncbi:hypothetical protein [Leptospira interrogans]|uniref:Uncharacterized protein n=1 Tax=Leptospira interrogans serovar Canicola TaxID=211880 RepID=A0AAP9WGY8_LEPIR|nr:hypothetical protein [Leptospira interrogans]QOI44927.1 hypothetical protein Lepto782_22185 [Leptospira interrogans serovar Canicola]